MTDDRVIAYLRARSQVEPPATLVASVLAAVDSAPAARSRFSVFLPAAVAMGAAAVVAVLALVLGPGRDVGPPPAPSVRASDATVDELEVAVTAAVEVLRSQPGVEGIGEYRVLDELGSVSWFSWRPNGDQVVVLRSDVDVTESGWWLGPDDEPLTREVNVRTTMQALVGSGYYFTRGDLGADDAWIGGLREGSPDVLGVPFPAALDGRMDPWQGEFVLTLEGDASVTPLADNGEAWTLTRPFREGSLVQTFEIGPNGALRSMTHELVGVTPTVDDRPVTSAVIELTILEDPEPIPAPDVDSPPDPTVFGMPELRLGPDPGDAAIDYRTYVEDVLAALESSHWNAANVDWAAARAAALEGLPDNPTADQAHARIRRAIETFDVFNTAFIRPQDVPPGGMGGAGGLEPAHGLPVGDRIAGVGVIVLPTPAAGGADELGEYLEAARLAMADVEAQAPACGWVVDLRAYDGYAWGPSMFAIGGLLGDGRALTFRSPAGEWWLEVDDRGVVSAGGFDDADLPVYSRYISTVDETAADTELMVEIASMSPYDPAVQNAPIAVLVGNATRSGGEQTVVAFLGRPGVRTFGGPTAGIPVVAPNLRMADGAVLRIPTWTPVDASGVEHTTNVIPDELIGDTRATGGDAVLDAAVDWLGAQPGCS